MGLSSDEFSRRARVGHRLLLQPDAVGPGLLSLVQGLDQPARRQDRDDSSSGTFGRESVKRSRRIYLCGYGLARRMADLKTITDTVHGTIRLDPLTLDLLETLELQRLNSIRQLGLTYLVFPGANHSRVEHCLGVGHVAGEMARALGLSDDERKLVQAAGLLHDVGPGPFSHTLEPVLRREPALDRKGLPALEGMLVARGLMYSSVYFHKTVRIAEEMLARAVERSDAPIADIQKMVDHELLNWLMHQGPLQREIALRLKYRKLYKRVLASDRDDLTDATRAVLASFKDPDERRRVEDRIAPRAGVKPGQVIADVPLPALLLSEPRIAKTGVPILDDCDVKPFSKVSPLGRALQVRQVVDWVVMVAAPGEAVDAVRKASKAALFE